MLKTSQIHIRDPFVLLYQDHYYLYGTTDDNCWQGEAQGLDVFVSDDLENWQEAHRVFAPSKDFWGTQNYWAPEVHLYDGGIYMFASFKSPDRRRATIILRADTPLGPFVPWGEDITPRDWECLDGTLYVDSIGIPWMVFCHEWVQQDGGTICARKLKKDLSGPDGDVVTLFYASDVKWTKQINHSSGITGHVTDGPNIYKPANGELWLLWSSHTDTGYGIGLSKSGSGTIFGPWIHEDEAIYKADGGHGMIFVNKQGKKYLAIHTPNDTPNERPIFLPVHETRDGLAIEG